jgi:lipoprotein-anchoring transpeptidase ErfK/SrfK
VFKALVIGLLLIAVLAGAGAAALQRYDAGHADLIAEGVTIGGVDVGGLEVNEARARLDRRIVDLLQRPLRLAYGQRRFQVDAGLVDVEVNPEPALAQALAESREGNFLTRSLRDLRGEQIDADIPLPVEYSEEAVARIVAGVRRAVDQPMRNAKSSVSLVGVDIAPSQVGTSVRTHALRRAIERRLVRPGARRSVAVPVRRLPPKVTTAELERRFRTLITVSRGARVLRWFVGRELVKEYRVGIGQAGFETPAGLYKVESKAINPSWWVPNKAWAGELAGKVIPGDDPRNPIEARWMGFYDGAGIHGTADVASIGTAASHGCVRMTIPDVEDLYDRVPLGTPLYIA